MRLSKKAPAAAPAGDHPTWYDLLGVAPAASTDEIRTAWKSAVEGLDPTDRRFRSLSDAAAVLLDDDKRTAYDATLPTSEVERTAEVEPVETTSDDTTPSRRVPVVRGWLLAGLGIVAALAVAAAAVSYAKSPSHETGGTVVVANDNESVATSGSSAGKKVTYDHTLTVEEDGAAALAAAKTAIVPLVSYDYRDLSKSETAAEAYMTQSYKTGSYTPLMAQLAGSIASTKAVVTADAPVDAGVVRVSPGVVQVLLFFDRSTTRADTKKPTITEDQATLTMQDVDGTWLVNGLATTPASS